MAISFKGQCAARAHLSGVRVEAGHVNVIPDEDEAADELRDLHERDERLGLELVAGGGERVVGVHDRVDERVEDHEDPHSLQPAVGDGGAADGVSDSISIYLSIYIYMHV